MGKLSERPVKKLKPGLTLCQLMGHRLGGQILINGVSKDQAQFSRYSAYVEQFDSFAQLNTVRETVEFSGRRAFR